MNQGNEYKSLRTYKCIITKGNNGVLVRNCFKQRWWWSIVDRETNYEEVNLIWT